MLIMLFSSLAIAAGIAAFFRPWLGVVIITLMIPFDFPLEMGLTVFTNELIFTGVFLGWIAHLVHQKKVFSISWKEVLVGLPLVAAILLSAINAESVFVVFKQCLRWLQLILIVWLVANALQNTREIKFEIKVLISIAVLAAVVGIIQSLAGPDSILNFNQSQMMLYQNRIIRAYGTFGHPNQFAGYLLCVIPLAGVQCLAAHRKQAKVLAGLALGILLTAFILTYTRGAWLSAFFMGLIWFYVNVTKKIFFSVLVGLALVLILISVIAGQSKKPGLAVAQRLISIVHPQQEDSVGFRTVCMRTAWQMFKKHPVIGFGAGDYTNNIKQYFNEDYYAWEAMSKHIHNLYLQILIEAGLLGILGFLFWLVAHLARIGKTLIHYWPQSRGSVIAAVLVGALAYSMANNFDVLTMYARGIYFGIILGIGLASIRINALLAKEQR